MKMGDIRRHYMTLFTRNKEGDVVTYVDNQGIVEVTIETPCKSGFKTVVIDENCNVLDVDGFSHDDVVFYQNYVKNNIALIKELSLRDAKDI